jgi:hypothetical protein
MAVWGVLDDQPEYTAHAVTAGLEMQIALFEFNRDEPVRAKFQLPAGGLSHGIGLCTGKVCAGNIGSMQKIEFTVIGDAVNIANRIESLAGRGQVFISESDWTTVADRAFGFRLPAVTLKNVRQSPKLVAIRGIVPPGAQNLRTDEMLLNIPCEVTAAGAPPVECLITGIAKNDNKTSLVLQTQSPLPPDKVCQIACKLPESTRFPSFNGTVLRIQPAATAGDDTSVPLASDVRCGIAHEDGHLAPGTAVIETPALPSEWLEIKPGAIFDSDYKSEHEIIR